MPRRPRRPRRRLLALLAAVGPLLLLLLLLLLAAAPLQTTAPVWQPQQRNASGPGPRYGHVAWADPEGSGGWVLGGWGNDSTGQEGRLNDLWRTADGVRWEHVGGSTVAASDGLYDLSHAEVVASIVAEACQVSITVHVHVLWWGNEITWRLSEGGPEYGPYPDMTDQYTEVVVGIGQHTMIALDRYGDGWQGGYWEVTLTATGQVLAGGPQDGLVGDGFRMVTPFEIALGNCGDLDLSRHPGARAGAAVATVGSAVYMFGGTGHTRKVWGSLNDLWRHSAAASWEWISGSSLPGARGRYGLLGQVDRSNMPGSRRGHAMWADGPSAVWLFGGTGSASETASALGGIGYLSDR